MLVFWALWGCADQSSLSDALVAQAGTGAAFASDAATGTDVDAPRAPDASVHADAGHEHASDAASSVMDAATHAADPVLPFDCPADQFALQKVALSEVSLQVACRGQTGPVLLMLHGYPELHLAWNRLAPPLAAAGFQVLAPDQRGYASSDKPEATEAYAIDHLVRDIHELIERSKQRKVLLIGHDWGGVVAWVFAHRYPDMVRGLVVMNAPHPDIWGHPEVDPVQARASDNYIPLLAGPLGGLSQPVIDSMLAPHLTTTELEQYRAAWNQPNAMASMNKWYQANVYPKYTLPSKNTIEVPTLALWGEDDEFVTTSELELLPDYVSDLEVVRFKGVDHWITHQVTSELVEEILAFEQRLD